MKFKLSLKDPKILSFEAKAWIQEVEDKINNSKLLKQKVYDIAIYGTSLITDEEIIAEISNEK